MASDQQNLHGSDIASNLRYSVCTKVGHPLITSLVNNDIIWLTTNRDIFYFHILANLYNRIGESASYPQVVVLVTPNRVRHTANWDRNRQKNIITNLYNSVFKVKANIDFTICIRTKAFWTITYIDMRFDYAIRNL